MSKRLYWPSRRDPKPPPPKPKPEDVANLIRLKRSLAEREAADDDLACCPKCAATKGVHMAKEFGTRLHYVVCHKCGFRTYPIYGNQDARRKWNKIDRTHLRRADP